jgi:uncharacterized protein
MTQMIFVNLPVADLGRAKAFYEAIGFTNEPKFTNHMAACMVLSDTISVMLLTHDFWATFTRKRRVDPKAEAQVLLCISRDDRQAVDAITEAAVKAGGSADPCPRQDYGFMYGRSFEDPDGHVWEPMWMSAEAVEKGPMEISDAG